MNKLYRKYYLSELTIDVPPQYNNLDNIGTHTYSRNVYGDKLYYGKMPDEVKTTYIDNFDKFYNEKPAYLKTKNMYFITKCNEYFSHDGYMYNAISWFKGESDWVFFNKEDFIQFTENQTYEEVEDRCSIEELMNLLSKEEFLMYLSDKIKENS